MARHISLWPWPRLLSLGIVILSHCANVKGQLTGNGLSLVLDDINYFVSPYIAGHITPDSLGLSNVSNVYGFVPVTVVQDAVASGDLSALFSNWTKVDDVFQDGFAGVVITSTNNTSQSLQALNADRTTVHVSSLSNTVPSGPYFVQVSTGALHQVYRLYDDFSGSFTTPLLQTPEGTFQPLSAQIATSATLTIGVPSRLYYTKTAEKPLAGVRIGVKDIFQLAGVKSSYGSRAYYHFYDANNVTGTAIQRLIDAGAQIVGLQKPSQFANGATATADWVDYHAPFNARGDGYQDPSSSSSGAGASIASYPWLDIAVGSDTGGSIRNPAEVSGVFGNRPSHNIVSLDHAMPLSEHLDTAGFLTRDPYLWDVAQSVMYGDNYTSFVSGTSDVVYPTTIYTVDFPTTASSDADTILINFANKIASFIGSNTTALDLNSAWLSSNVTGASDASLDEFLNTTYPVLITKEQTALVRDPFYADYAAKYDNRIPFVDPSPSIRWGWGDSLPEGALDDAINEKTIFMNWFDESILSPSDDVNQCSSAILLYPGSTGLQDPRNLYGGPPSIPIGFTDGRISVFSGCPDSVFPVGQFSGFSSITQHDEFLPVTVDVMVAKGCDGLLVRLAQDLVAEGLVVVPQAGQTIYGGDVLMRR